MTSLVLPAVRSRRPDWASDPQILRTEVLAGLGHLVAAVVVGGVKQSRSPDPSVDVPHPRVLTTLSRIRRQRRIVRRVRRLPVVPPIGKGMLR